MKFNIASVQLNVNKKDTGLTSIESEKLATSTKEIPEYFVKLGIDNPDELDNLIINNDELTWIQNGDVLIHWIGSIDKIPYYFCNFKECKEKITLDWETDILKFDFMPNRKDVLLVLNNEGLWVVEVDDRSSSNIFPIYLGEGIDFIVNEQNKILVLDSNIFYELDF